HQVGNEDLPDPRGAAVTHHVPPAVPVVELSDDADPERIGSPDGEVNTTEALVRDEVGAQALEVPVVRTFAQEMQVEFTQDRSDLVRVAELQGVPFVVLDSQTVGETLGTVAEARSEEPIKTGPDHGTRDARLARREVDHLGPAPLRQEYTDHL